MEKEQIKSFVDNAVAQSPLEVVRSLQGYAHKVSELQKSIDEKSSDLAGYQEIKATVIKKLGLDTKALVLNESGDFEWKSLDALSNSKTTKASSKKTSSTSVANSES